jgi:hypothetical protein
VVNPWHAFGCQADESDKVRSEASARLATLAAYKAAMDSLADSLAASEPLQVAFCYVY